MYQINKKHNYFFVLLYGLLSFLLIVSFLLIQKIDILNMVNNGFVSNNAIYFILNERQLDLHEVKGDYLLFQFDKNRSESEKYIRIKGDINLPSIDYFGSNNTVLHNNSIIIGEKVPIKAISKDYPIVGVFSVTNNYKFFNEVWIITTNDLHKTEKGQFFIFQSPNKSTREKFKAFLKTKSVKMISPTVEGTYASKGNQLLIKLIKIISIFLFIVLLILVTKRLFLEKDKLHILYLYGSTFKRLFSHTFAIIWLLQFLTWSLCVCSIIYYGKNHLNLWSNEWVVKIWISTGVLILYTTIVSVLFFYIFTVKRGGKKT